MSALALLEPATVHMHSMPVVAPALPVPSRGARLFQLVGDGYEPTLRGGDYLMVVDVDRFAYDASYLLDFGDGESAFLASRSAGGYRVRRLNPKYAECGWEMTRPEFFQAVRAIVVAEVKMTDAALLRAVASDAATPAWA